MSPADPPSTQSGPPQTRPPSSEPSRARSSRRAFLTSTGTAATATLAGCNGLSGSDGTAPFSEGNWHGFGNADTNANRVAGGAPALADQEHVIPGSWLYAPPVVHDGAVYFVTDQRIVAVAADGDDQWSRSLEGEAPEHRPSTRSGGGSTSRRGSFRRRTVRTHHRRP